jgi:hypothetical protein
MKLRSHFLSLLAISSTFVLTNCFGGGPSYSYQNVTISVAPQPASVPVNSTQTFTATVTNAPPLAVWIVQGSQVPSVSVGTITTATTDAPTSTYTAPAVPPIYTDDEVAAGSAQGTITILAEANSVRGSFTFVTATTTFVITGPISVGLSPMTASLNVGGTQQFTGYAVGSLNNALTWQVNGVPGGGTATGTVTTAGLYTAPAALPMTGNTVTITAVSQADTTKTVSAVVTLASS